MYNKTINQNIIFNHLKTDKFKSIRIRLSFLTPITKENATLRAILPYMMRAGSKNYPTRMNVSSTLNELYSAKFNTGVSKKGENHVILFDMAIINDSYTLFNEKLFEEALHFIQDIIYHPILSKETYTEEYRLMEEYYQSIYANKMRFTIDNLMNTMFKDELYKINALGDIDTLHTITYEDVLKEYNKMINEDLLTITIVGDIEEKDALPELNKVFIPHSFNKDIVLVEKTRKEIKEVTKNTIIQDVNQAKLVLGYRLPVYYKEENYYEAIMFDMLFGGSSESLLFKTLREELGLVYSVHSAYNPFKGVFFIYIGINASEKENVLKQINTLIENVTTSNIDEEYLAIAKKQYINSLIQSYDSLSGLTYKLEHSSLYNTELDINKTITSVTNVTLKEVGIIASLLNLDTYSFLKGENDE